MFKPAQWMSAIGAMTIASCISVPAGAFDGAWCSLQHRDPTGATSIPPSDIFLVDKNRVEIAISRLRSRRMVVLTNRDAANYITGWTATPGHHIYLVRAGIATGNAASPEGNYDIAKYVEFFGFLHTDGELEIVTPQIGPPSPKFDKLPLIVRSRNVATSASAVCHYLAEEFR